ncbi:hypothetical protein Pcinc_023033 [Petrolisthes cinctipes]|uniref:Uncharacterized protein n=1 Tax=Petrolisthes cinctipes TaxID=88211 RepID=A0AAE1FEB9_PETCI|nr:hypothetical protein Pcinc_023033 [Petrolisthes cinctipes]
MTGKGGEKGGGENEKRRSTARPDSRALVLVTAVAARGVRSDSRAGRRSLECAGSLATVSSINRLDTSTSVSTFTPSLLHQTPLTPPPLSPIIPSTPTITTSTPTLAHILPFSTSTPPPSLPPTLPLPPSTKSSPTPLLFHHHHHGPTY